MVYKHSHPQPLTYITPNHTTYNIESLTNVFTNLLPLQPLTLITNIPKPL